MLMRELGKLVIWPAYFDIAHSRKDGRVLSKKNSIKVPDLKEIEKAAEKLGLNPNVEPDKAYPKFWWEISGRVLVDKNAPKTDTVRQIVEKIKQMRAQ